MFFYCFFLLLLFFQLNKRSGRSLWCSIIRNRMDEWRNFLCTYKNDNYLPYVVFLFFWLPVKNNDNTTKQIRGIIKETSIVPKKLWYANLLASSVPSVYSGTRKTRTKVIILNVYLDQNYSRFYILFDVHIANKRVRELFSLLS